MDKIKVYNAIEIRNAKTISDFQNVLIELNKVYNIVETTTGNTYSARISNISMDHFSQNDMINNSKELNDILNCNNPAILKIIGESIEY